MPRIKKDLLFDLIKSLTKTEKRNFKIYAKKIQQNGEVLFLQLFNYLEKQTLFDVNVLLSSSEQFKKRQIANLKRNLYHHLLTSLRLLYSQKYTVLEIREFLDHAEILYNKGLYLQALKLLARAKKISSRDHQHILHLEIIAFESRIESRHITRSSTQRMTDLMKESKEINEVIIRVSNLSNLKLYLQRVFINEGHLKTLQQQQQVHQYFQQKMSQLKSTNPSFFEEVFYFQSYYWYHFLLQDFENCFYYSQKWVQLYEVDSNMIDKDIDMYLRAIHHLLNSAFFITNESILVQKVHQFELFIKDKKDHISLNTYVQAHLFFYQAKFNQYFINEKFKEGVILIPEVLEFIEAYDYQLDNYKIMILYYKIACCYFGTMQPDKALDYLNKIINSTGSVLREDILLYARILAMLCYYEMGNEVALEYIINATERQLSNIFNPDQLSVVTIVFLKQLNRAIPRTERNLFLQYQLKLTALESIVAERRAFLFLNLSLWVAKKI